MTQTETFEPLTLQEITAATAKVPESKVDETWKNRIATLQIGGGFRIHRTEAESTRQLKTRINRSSLATGRKLAWYPQSGTLADGKPSSYVVKVVAINVPQNGQEGTQEGQQPSEGENTGTESSEENASVGPRRGRS